MPRVPSPSLNTDLTASITSPGYLLYIGFTTPLRLSSRGNLTFQGNSFIEWGFDVRGLTPSIESSGNGSITFHDPDESILAYIVSEGIEEKLIRLWVYSGDVAEFSALDLYNPIELYNGYAAEAQAQDGVVNISLRSVTKQSMYTPRVRMTRETGFTRLPVDGKEYEFGGEKWKAESEK